jgi:hypothetical protein
VVDYPLEVLPSAWLKRRGIVAIQEALRRGPAHLLDHNQPTAMVLSEEHYLQPQELVRQAPHPERSSLAWFLLQPPASPARSKAEIDAERAWTGPPPLGYCPLGGFANHAPSPLERCGSRAPRSSVACTVGPKGAPPPLAPVGDRESRSRAPGRPARSPAARRWRWRCWRGRAFLPAGSLKCSSAPTV